MGGETWGRSRERQHSVSGYLCSPGLFIWKLCSAQRKGSNNLLLVSPALVNRLCFWCLALCGSCYDSAVFMAFTEVIPSDALSQVCVQM